MSQVVKASGLPDASVFATRGPQENPKDPGVCLTQSSRARTSRFFVWPKLGVLQRYIIRADLPQNVIAVCRNSNNPHPERRNQRKVLGLRRLLVLYLENFSRGLKKAPFCVRRRKLGSPKNCAAFLLFPAAFFIRGLKEHCCHDLCFDP